MTAVPKPKLTLAEYYAKERAAPFKSEFFRGDTFAMAGASREHNTIKENLVIDIGGQLKGSSCRSFSSDQRVRVETTGLVTYPDIVIVCGTPEFDPEDRDTLLKPLVIIEVLSPSTEKYDRGVKFHHYQKLDSLREYILVSQEKAVCDHYLRQQDGSWKLTSLFGLTAELNFCSVPARVRLADVYREVDFPPEPSM